jgi:hypothetical protein
VTVEVDRLAATIRTFFFRAGFVTFRFALIGLLLGLLSRPGR